MPHPRLPGPTLPFAFTVTAAKSRGLTRGWLDHPSLSRPFYGVRSTQAWPADLDTAESRVLFRAQQALPRLRPGEAVSHQSALLLYGCPIHTREELHVTAQPLHTRNRTTGIAGHRCKNQFPIQIRHGVPTVSPTQALVQAAASLPLRELIVATDHLIRRTGYGGRTPPLINPDELKHDTSTNCGRGITTLRSAIVLADPGSESRMETLTRLLLAAFGLAEHFGIQVELEDEAGRIGRFDFVSLTHKLIVEYDGEQHRRHRPQYLHDLKRLERARMAGYRVIRLVREDITDHPRQTAKFIAEALGIQMREHQLLPALLAN